MPLTRQDIYDAWIPRTSPWSDWAKPVLFASLDLAAPVEGHSESSPAGWHWMPAMPRTNADTALVIDLPGDESVIAGGRLAELGYQPVPIFNGAPAPRGTRAAIDTRPMADALRTFAPRLMDLQHDRLGSQAPPAFLLDSRRRLGSSPPPGQFDNRWMVFPQDFPSARFLQERGVARAIVVQEQAGQPAEDLRHVLRRWQDAGIAIERCRSGQAQLEPFVVASPSHFRWALHRTLAICGLRRNAAGGFGAVVPKPSEGGGGGFA